MMLLYLYKYNGRFRFRLPQALRLDLPVSKLKPAMNSSG
jgi:hypothetical protein